MAERNIAAGKKRWILLDIYKLLFISVIAVGHFLQFFPNIQIYIPEKIYLFLIRSYVFVEFFFIVSGFMVGNTIYTSGEAYDPGKIFLKRMKQLYPAYFLSTIICGLALIAVNSDQIRETIFAWCGELTFANSLGIDLGRTNAPAWYVSALLFATLFILLLAKILIKRCDKKIVPILFIAFGVCCYSYVKYSVFTAGIGFTLSDHIERQILPLGTVRALGGVSIGVGLYGIYNGLKEKIDRWITVFFFLLGIGLMAYAYLSKNAFETLRFQSEMVMVVGFIFLIIGSLGIYREPKAIAKKVFSYSFPCFLNHYAAAIIVSHICGNEAEKFVKLIPLFFAITILFSAVMIQLQKLVNGVILYKE